VTSSSRSRSKSRSVRKELVPNSAAASAEKTSSPCRFRGVGQMKNPVYRKRHHSTAANSHSFASNIEEDSGSSICWQTVADRECDPPPVKRKPRRPPGHRGHSRTLTSDSSAGTKIQTYNADSRRITEGAQSHSKKSQTYQKYGTRETRILLLGHLLGFYLCGNVWA